MEEKKIKLIEKNENAILGQEAVFGWELKFKEKIKNVLFFKANEYTLVRNIDENELTQAHKDVENRWNALFDKWNNIFIFKKYSYYLISMIVLWVILIVSFILMAIGSEGALIASIIIDVIVIIGFIVIIALMVPQIKKINELDKISREMRQVNSIRKNNENNE